MPIQLTMKHDLKIWCLFGMTAKIKIYLQLVDYGNLSRTLYYFPIRYWDGVFLDLMTRSRQGLQHIYRTTLKLLCDKIMHYRGRVLCESRFQIFGRLTNEYLLDMFGCNLDTQLNYICINQKHLRQEDASLMDVPYVPDHQNIYLPSSFLGSNRWASEQIANSLVIAAAFGPPTFFVTFTCNANWPEIQSQLRPGQDFTDVPIVVVHVFQQKLSTLESTLKSMFPNAGRLLYIIHSIEFQKRGLPHAHILLKFEQDCVHPCDIDAIVNAEMPSDPDDAQ